MTIPANDSPVPSVAEIAKQMTRIASENAGLLRRLDESEGRFRLISKGVLRVQEAECGRIARDLHDGVGQALTAIKIELELAEQDAHRGALAERLADVRELVERTLQDVRALAHALRPSMLDDLGLIPTLRGLARTFQKRTGLDVRVDLEETDERFDPDVETLVYRVAQEALTNAAKYADASRVQLTLDHEPSQLNLRVADDGRGFDAAAVLSATVDERGFGLRGMRDRVHLFGGRFQVTSSAGRGTTVQVELPI